MFIRLAPLALLAACQGDAPTEEGASASGEVLEGTISDAMIPLETLTSEPPLAAPTRTGGSAAEEGSDAGAAEEGAEGGAAEDTAAPETEPAADTPEE